MKKTIIIFCTLCLFISCKKNSGLPDQIESESYPVTWIFTVDESIDKYTYLRSNLTNMFRKQVDKTYSMTQLAIDENCEFRVAQSRSEDHKECFTIQLEKNRKIWVSANLSTNKQEVHLSSGGGSSETTAPGDSDNYKFFIRRMDKVNGVITVTIESVNFPGYYISTSTPGFVYAQNEVVLTKETSPEKATHWQCR
jgi:hypothetical protein